jgi:predicted TIM-barrel fold metal-dependent hydrolase
MRKGLTMQITRRGFGALALGSAAAWMSESANAGAATGTLPGACDCHVHIIGPQAKYPMVPYRAYTPPEATVAQLRALRSRIGMSRSVIVQPSFYGTDNSCMLDAMAELGSSARGIAVVAPNTPLQTLRDLDAKGVRGVRINLESAGNRDPRSAVAFLQQYAHLVAPLNWHIQIFAAVSVIGQIAGEIADLRVPVVVDHFGLPEAAGGFSQRGFGGMFDLLRAKVIHVKLSAPYRVSKVPDYSDTDWLGRTLVQGAPDRVLWATDWPHTQTIPGRPREEVTPFYRIDNAAILRRFTSWCADEATRKMILVDNPARLYRFT